MADRGHELVLHVGMGKTGSTALQIALVRHRDDLADRGIEYPESAADAAALRGDVVSGNARDLEDFLVPSIRAVSDAQSATALARTVERASGSRLPTVLFSSEFLFSFQPPRLAALRDALDEKQVRLRVVAYVRDLAGHALSTYSQVVKRSLYTDDVTTFLRERYRPGLHPKIKAAMEILGAEGVQVLHYDTEKTSLYPGFMDRAFGVDVPRDAAARSREVVNRSLTAHEVNLMRYLNTRLPDRKAAQRVSDRMMELAPPQDTPLALTEAQLAWMDARFGPAVAWVNERHFGGRSLLSVRGTARAAPAEARDADIGPKERFLLDCMAAMATR